LCGRYAGHPAPQRPQPQKAECCRVKHVPRDEDRAALRARERQRDDEAVHGARSRANRATRTAGELEGLSYEEIAKMMDCPIGTVRSRIFRAREAIAERLRPLLETSAGKRW